MANSAFNLPTAEYYTKPGICSAWQKGINGRLKIAFPFEDTLSQFFLLNSNKTSP
jgi:hypothetical protein